MSGGWTTASLGDVAVIERRGVDPSSLEDDTVYLGLEHIEAGGRIIGSSTVRASAVASTKFRFGREHVLFGKLRPYLGKIAAPDFAGVCSTDILPIRPGDGLDRQYLLHFLRQPSVVARAAARATGANLPRLSAPELARFELPLPPIEEQRRISAILDSIDKVRALRGVSIYAARQLRDCLFDVAVAPVTQRVDFHSAMTSGPSNGLYKPAFAYGEGVPIVRIDSFVEGGIDQSSLRRLRIEGPEIERFGLAKGDIVINRVNALSHVGKAALIRALDEPTVYESNMMRIRLRAGWEPEYVISWLGSAETRRQIRSRAKQAINQASINGRDVKDLQIPAMSLDRQRDLVTRLKTIDNQLDRLQLGARRLESMSLALQARAFSGRL